MMRKSYFFKQRLFAAILMFVMGVGVSYADDIIVNPNTTTQGNSVCCFDASYEDPYSTTQSIYTADELGNKSGNITAISYMVYMKGTTFRPNMQIYMGVTSKSGFSSYKDAFTSTDLTLVYEGTPILGGAAKDDWDQLPLQHSFYYNGTGNLVVVVCTNGVTADEDAPLYKTYNVSGDYRLLSRSADTGDANYQSYGNISIANSSLTAKEYLPCVKFTLGDASSVADVTVGAGTKGSTLAPYDNAQKYSISQSLYTMGELGGAGKITDISYYVTSASTYSPDELKIYMGHKDMSFTDKTGLSSSDLTLVYSKTNPVLGKTTGWENITLDTPFSYSGNENLVVVVCKKASTVNSDLGYQYTDMTTDKYFLCREGDVEGYANIANTSYGYSAFCQRPNIKFTKESTSGESDTNVSSMSDAVYTEKTECLVGSDAKLAISLKNTTLTNLTAFQFDLNLPDGITVDTDDDDYVTISSSRTTKSKHSVTGRYASNGDFRVICSSTENSVFSGTDGQVVNVLLKADDTVSPGDYKIKIENVVVSDVNSVPTALADFVSTVTVDDYIIGDANSDRTINVADYVGVINNILTPDSATGNTKAMDTNLDGKVNIADAVGVINLILKQ